MTIAKADFIEGMAKGMAVLESFDTERQRLNATLAAQRAGITRAAARRHLLTLAHLGYLETDGSYFWLAPKVLRFSGSYLASARLPRVLQPTLEPAGGADGRVVLGRGARRRPGGDRRAQRLDAGCWPTACTWARGCRRMPPRPGACCWPPRARPSSTPG